jgi:tRNA-dihydrouridine synthase
VSRALPFTAPALLAPMEGVTDPVFRDLVLEQNPPSALGGAFTEFARVVDLPLPRRILAEHLGPRRFPAPVGLQLMGSDLAALAATAERAVELGAPLIDLNFGCPSKGALRGCAGSALLDDPQRLEAVVRACRAAVGDRPLSAKIRAGGDDDRDLETLARAVEQGGADLLTVHCRTRAEGYADTADWERLRRAVAAVSIPVCGNGGVNGHGDLERLREETGCRFAMVGRAALGDPWIFSGRRVDPATAARFLLDYGRRLREAGGAGPGGAVRRIKQLLRHWTAGGLVDGEREQWLRLEDPGALLERLAERADGAAVARASGICGS